MRRTRTAIAMVLAMVLCVAFVCPSMGAETAGEAATLNDYSAEMEAEETSDQANTDEPSEVIEFEQIEDVQEMVSENEEEEVSTESDSEGETAELVVEEESADEGEELNEITEPEQVEETWEDEANGIMEQDIEQAVWTSNNTTLTFYYGPLVSKGDLFMGGIVTDVWSGTDVTLSGNGRPKWCYKGADSPINATNVVFDSSFSVVRPTSTHYWFLDFGRLESIDFSGLNTSNVTDMSGMFCNCGLLTSLNLKSFDTSNVLKMNNMFDRCHSLSRLNVSSFNTSKVTDMAYMFCECGVTGLNLSGFDTSNVTDMCYMFNGCTTMTDLNLSGFRTSSVTDMFCMFYDCSALTSLDVSSFSISSATNIDRMFQNCSSLNTIICENETTNWSGPEGFNMFLECDNLFATDGENEVVHDSSCVDGFMAKSATLGGYFTPKETNTIRGSFKSNDKEFSGDFGFCYKNSYFDQPATTYNHSLATMSLCMAFSAYGNEASKYEGYDQNIRTLMQKCGFSRREAEPRCGFESYGYNIRPDADSIACAIGSKILPNGIPLIAVAVRGGGYEAEWASNFTVGNSNDHAGFDKQTAKIVNYIKDYLSKKGISGSIKIWITGFSRGAAVATQTAAKLNREGLANAIINKESIYAYGFATPAGAIKDSNPHSSNYNNIFNIIDFNDPVPLVAPAKWGFDRYGITYILPNEVTSLYSGYYVNNREQYIKKMGGKYVLHSFSRTRIIASIYHAVTAINSSSDEVGVFNRELIDKMAGKIGNRDNFCSSFQTKMRQFGSEVLGHRKYYGSEEKYAKYKSDSVACALIKSSDLLSIIDPFLVGVVIDNYNIIAVVHAEQQYYISWMQSMDPNYKNSLPLKWGANDYRAVVVNCPVDVFVYDSNDDLVASIVDERPVEIENSTIISRVDENESKTVYLPVDEEYKVKVVPRENCEVTYSVSEYGAEYGNEKRSVVFTNVEVSEGEELLGSTDAFSENDLESNSEEGSSVVYELRKEDEEITPALDLKGADEIIDHEYEVAITFDEEQGTVYGAGKYVEGSYVKLLAENRQGYVFEGFYVNGERLTDEDSDNSKNSVRVQVRDDITVEARFGICEHAEWAETVTKEPTSTEPGEKTITCVVCGESRVEEIPIIKPALGKTTRGDMFNLANNVKVTWKEVPGAKYYKVYREGITDPKESVDEPVIVTERLIGWDEEPGLTNGHAYRYKIVASLTGKDDSSGDSSLSYSKLMYRLKTVVIRSVKNTAPGKVTVKYDKTNSGDSYVLAYSEKEDLSDAKSKVVLGANNTSYTLSGLKKGKTYYISIRVRKKVDGIDYYTTFGVPKKIKITQ